MKPFQYRRNDPELVAERYHNAVTTPHLRGTPYYMIPPPALAPYISGSSPAYIDLINPYAAPPVFRYANPYPKNLGDMVRGY